MRSLLFTCIVALAAAPAAAHAQSVTCADGTTSEAGRGACSHHGGIAKTRASEPKREAAPRETSKTSARESTRTTTARVRCTDGTYSSATGRGACSRHGGVAGTTERADTREPPRKTDTTATVVHCADGSISIATGRGACSHHGGVAEPQARTSTTKETRDTRAPRRDTRSETGNNKPWWGDEGLRDNEAMARCTDGTISYSRHHRGTCSSHGGVREWLDD
jgi:hypothetical protein